MLNKKRLVQINELIEINGSEILEGKNKLSFYESLPLEYKQATQYQVFCLILREAEKEGLITFKKNSSLTSDSNSETKVKPIIKLKEKEEFSLSIFDPKETEINKELFKPLKTSKGIDIIFSDEGGVMPACTFVIIGKPGAGKTTLANAIINDVQQTDPTSNCLSFTAEMKRSDVEAEIIKKDWMRNVKHVILTEHAKEDWVKVIEKVILGGYDLLVVDSFQNIVERLRAEFKMTSSEAASFLMEMFEKANNGENETGKRTTILLIQQVTKGGEFAGKNSLMHDTTGMLECGYDVDTHERYCSFTKNRRNGEMMYKKLFYSLDSETKEVVYNIEKFNEDLEEMKILSHEKENLIKQKESFNRIFGSRNSNEEEDLNESSDNKNESVFHIQESSNIEDEVEDDDVRETVNELMFDDNFDFEDEE